ncbi:MAG: TrkH family potassium uptake protein [Brucellaceae bacterium]|nr:TrkH family potassium uptake protein [Brucellaceae bacterium]
MHASTIRAAVYVAAAFAVWLSVLMLAPAAIDLYYGNPDWQVFLISAFSVGGVSAAVAMATRGAPPRLSPRMVFLTVNLLWMAMSVAGAIPLLEASLKLDFTDAVFESVSAVTTTGSTVITGLDSLPPGILIWRSILQWMGGLGVIALGLFLLPFLKIGGMSYFKVESSDIGDKPFERFSVFTIAFIGIYAALTMVCAFCYAAAGMSGFDALNHAMTTLATGGFSTHDTSFGYFKGDAVLWVGSVFMLIAGLPFSILLVLLLKRRWDAARDPQIRVYLAYAAAFSLLFGAYAATRGLFEPTTSIAQGAFTAISLLTTTGFASADYSLWGPFAIAIAFIATFMGGCSGSTAGGIKAYRFFILFKLVHAGLKRLIYPSGIHPVTYGLRNVDADMARAVLLFISAFLVLLCLGTGLLAATGLDFVTSLTGTLTALTNVGPGLGEVIGPAGNFATLSNPAKWVLIVGMLLGRLEILTVLILLLPEFWSD